MNNKERVSKFLDTYDAEDGFDGNFSRLKSVALTSQQVGLVNKILLKERLRYTAIWLIFSILLASLLLYGHKNFRNSLQEAFVILVLSGSQSFYSVEATPL